MPRGTAVPHGRPPDPDGRPERPPGTDRSTTQAEGTRASIASRASQTHGPQRRRTSRSALATTAQPRAGQAALGQLLAQRVGAGAAPDRLALPRGQLVAVPHQRQRGALGVAALHMRDVLWWAFERDDVAPEAMRPSLRP